MCYNEDINKQMSISFLHDEVNLYGDSGYIGAEKRQVAIARNKQDKEIRYKQNRKPAQIKKLSASGQWRAKKAEHQKSSVRAKGFLRCLPTSRISELLSRNYAGCPKPLHERSAGCAFRIRIGHYFQF